MNRTHSRDHPNELEYEMGYYGDEFYSSRHDKFVCGECFDDLDISAFIEFGAISPGCDFCGLKSSTKAIAAPLDDVVQFMSPAINREYERAVEALGWESAEGGYLGHHFDSYDLLEDEIGLVLPRDDDGRLLAILAKCLGSEPWCQRDPYGMREDERLIHGWERFCEFIKHQRRYFFLRANAQTPLHSEYLTPSQLLGFVSKSAEEYGFVKTLPAGSLIYRSRQQKPGECFRSPYDFGPPPIEHAVRSNRMSPAGIVMFYGSEDPETAIAEIDDAPQLGISVATFRTTRNAAILDLKTLPRRLRFFVEQSDSSTVNRYVLEFLHNFVSRLAAKVEPGEREHVDYVPTQVVTEYFRTTFRRNDSVLDGVCYGSAQRPGGKSLVLFADQGSIVLSPEEISELVRTGSYQEWQLRSHQEEAWLELVQRRIVRPPQPQVHEKAATSA